MSLLCRGGRLRAREETQSPLHDLDLLWLSVGPALKKAMEGG